MGSSTVARRARARLRAPATRPQGRPAAIFLLAIVFLWAGSGGHTLQAAVAQGGLSYFKTYFGNFGHVVGGVGLSGGGDSTGLATGTITIQGVPDTADIAAALLYWSSMEESNDPIASSTGTFRPAGGNPVVIKGKQIAPTLSANPVTMVPSCWGSGGGSGTTAHATNLHVYFTDVLYLLPRSTNDATFGKVLANGSFEVKLPDSGGGGSQSPSSGNQVIRTEGASLLIVY